MMASELFHLRRTDIPKAIFGYWKEAILHQVNSKIEKLKQCIMFKRVNSVIQNQHVQEYL